MGITPLGPPVLNRAKDQNGKIKRYFFGRRREWIEPPNSRLQIVKAVKKCLLSEQVSFTKNQKRSKKI